MHVAESKLWNPTSRSVLFKELYNMSRMLYVNGLETAVPEVVDMVLGKAAKLSQKAGGAAFGSNVAGTRLAPKYANGNALSKRRKMDGCS